MKSDNGVVVDGYFRAAFERLFPQIIQREIRDAVAEAINMDYSTSDCLIVQCCWSQWTKSNNLFHRRAELINPGSGG